MTAIRTHVVQQSAMITRSAVGLLGLMLWYFMCSTAQTRLAMQIAWTPTKTLSQYRMSPSDIDFTIVSRSRCYSLSVDCWAYPSLDLGQMS